MNRALISVIVPVYNAGKYLEKCLDSIIDQTYNNLEILIIDDASIDNSNEIYTRYATIDSRIKIHKNDLNKGISAARNTGLQLASGNYIAFVDSDDWVEKDYLEYMYNLCRQNNTEISVCSFYFVNNNNTNPVLKAQKTEILSGEDAVLKCMGEFGFFAWNKLFKRSLFEEVEFPEGKLFEDIGTIYQTFAKTDNIAFGYEPKYYYNRTNIQSVTMQKFSTKKLDYFEQNKKLLNYCISKGYKKAEKEVNRAYAYHIVGFIRQMIETASDDPQVVEPMLKQLKSNILLHLTSGSPLTNKLFAVALTLNYSIAKKIYKAIFK